MTVDRNKRPLEAKLIDGLYVEAMVLADEARSYFDRGGQQDRESLDPMGRVAFSCESLKVTTRLMHVVAWLLVRRAVDHGEISVAEARQPSRRLGMAADTEDAAITAMPQRAGDLVAASCDLYARVKRLDEELDRTGPVPSPARSLIDRIERSL